jgi:hypothetical protein
MNSTFKYIIMKHKFVTNTTFFLKMRAINTEGTDKTKYLLLKNFSVSTESLHLFVLNVTMH